MAVKFSQSTPLLAIGLLLLVAALATTVIGWVNRDPGTKSGRFRRSLDAVEQESDRRDREIEELTRP